MSICIPVSGSNALLLASCLALYCCDHGSGPPATPEIQAPANLSYYPEMIVRDQHLPFHMTSDATHLYWTNLESNQVMRSTKNGSNVEVFAEGQAGPTDLILDTPHLYWTNVNNGTIMRADTRGGPAEIVVQTDEPFSLAIDQRSIYWSTYKDGAIMKASKWGGKSTKIADSGTDGFPTIKIDDNNVYWTQSESAKVWRVSKTGGPSTTLAKEQNGPTAIVLDESHVYWINYHCNTAMRVAKYGDLPQPVAKANEIAIDEQFLYLSNEEHGALIRANKDGSMQTTLVLGQTGVGTGVGLLLDGSDIYWNTLTGGAIYRLDSTGKRQPLRS